MHLVAHSEEFAIPSACFNKCPLSRLELLLLYSKTLSDSSIILSIVPLTIDGSVNNFQLNNVVILVRKHTTRHEQSARALRCATIPLIVGLVNQTALTMGLFN